MALGAKFYELPVVREIAQMDGSGAARLVFKALRRKDEAACRLVLIESPRVSICSILGLPADAKSWPGLEIELVMFGETARVIYADFPSVAGHEDARKVAGSMGADLHHRAAAGGVDLALEGGPEVISAAHRSIPFFARTPDHGVTRELIELMRDYVIRWFQRMPAPAGNAFRLDLPDPAGDFLDERYAGSQGRRFLTSAFGTERAERLLRKFMFAPRWRVWEEKAAHAAGR